MMVDGESQPIATVSMEPQAEPTVPSEPAAEPVAEVAPEPAPEATSTPMGDAVATSTESAPPPEPATTTPTEEPQAEVVPPPGATSLEPTVPQAEPASNGTSPLKPLNHQTAKELSVKAHAATQNLIRKKLEKIMNLFSRKKAISNDDVQVNLIVSDATASRYLGELVKEGKIAKEGNARFTRYKKI